MISGVERRSRPVSENGAATKLVTGETVAVAIVEDRVKIRDGISLLLGATPGFRFAGGYGSMEQAIEPILESRPDVVLVDLVLPGMSGAEGIGLIHAERPDIPMLVFTVYEDDDRVFEALCAGALGCLPKKTPPMELLETLRMVASGVGGPMSPDCAVRTLALLRSGGAPSGSRSLPAGAVRLLELLSKGHNLRTASSEVGVRLEQAASMMRTIYDELHRRHSGRGG